MQTAISEQNVNFLPKSLQVAPYLSWFHLLTQMSLMYFCSHKFRKNSLQSTEIKWSVIVSINYNT